MKAPSSLCEFNKHISVRSFWPLLCLPTPGLMHTLLPLWCYCSRNASAKISLTCGHCVKTKSIFTRQLSLPPLGNRKHTDVCSTSYLTLFLSSFKFLEVRIKRREGAGWAALKLPTEQISTGKSEAGTIENSVSNSTRNWHQRGHIQTSRRTQVLEPLAHEVGNNRQGEVTNGVSMLPASALRLGPWLHQEKNSAFVSQNLRWVPLPSSLTQPCSSFPNKLIPLRPLPIKRQKLK